MDDTEFGFEFMLNGERFADVSYLPDLQKRYPEMLDKALVVLHEF